MFLPLSADTNDAILWFRPEQSRTVAWGGNPAEHSVRDPTGQISPRASFAAWEETVRGRSAPWTEVDLALAHAVRGALEFATAQRNKADLAKLRHYDYLTGLPNRSLFDEYLKKAADYAAGTSACLLFIDLDGFKEVNDKMGHAAGDAVLIEVSHRLLEAAGPANLVARLGGDEFVVLCPFMDRKALAGLGERVRKTINTHSGTVNRPWNVSSSIGIALAGETCGLNLLQAADMAMYAAKQAGGNRVVFFEASLFSRLSNRVELEQDMRDALNRGAEFVLLYQAVFGIAAETKRLVGFEVLLRWHHPKHGWMSPTTFMPLAERSGLILPLGDWVLSTALRQGRILREAYPSAKLMIHVNVSALQFVAPGYCLGVAGTLAAEAYPAEALCLEVVENLPADAAAAAVLADIRRLGVIVAIDGFGVGYASLSYLRRLPVDKLKLDRSFLENVSGDPEGMRFVAAVIAMAHAAKKSVVLEGVETEAEFHAALATGADTVQGFFFAPPMSAHAAADFVAQHSELDARHSPLLSAAPPWMVTLTSRPI